MKLHSYVCFKFIFSVVRKSKCATVKACKRWYYADACKKLSPCFKLCFQSINMLTNIWKLFTDLFTWLKKVLAQHSSQLNRLSMHLALLASCWNQHSMQSTVHFEQYWVLQRTLVDWGPCLDKSFQHLLCCEPFGGCTKSCCI